MVIQLWLAAAGVSPVSAMEGPPEYSLYIPLISNRYRSGMVYVPAGPFLMGCDPEHNGGFACEANELPLHEVVLEAYFIDKYEVTYAQYKECVAQGICQTIYMDPRYDNPVYAPHPVLVDIERAANYCTWAGKRLPSEEEWEKAARGPQPRAYPWGDQAPTCDMANYAPNWWNGDVCADSVVKVGSYPDAVSPYGALDMSGNLAEWTSSFPVS